MKKVISFLFLVFLFACGGDDAPTGSQATVLKGTVLEKASQQPVSGAKVSFGDMETTSDASGSYQLSNVPTVKQALRAEKANYAVCIEDYTVTGGENVMDIELESFAEYCTRVTSVTYQGRDYPTVLIGNQCWFQKNLNTGTRIDIEQEPSNDGSIEKYCYNDNTSNCDTYGALYKWDEAMNHIPTFSTQGICPDGWHIPTSTDLEALIAFVGEDGNALKSSDSLYWLQDELAGIGTNSSGFSGLGAGVGGTESGDPGYSWINHWTFFWTSTQDPAEDNNAYHLASLI